ncbi:MAG: polysaccharide biosynthesis/export family protein [Hyphomicrobiaceae bacterium]
MFPRLIIVCTVGLTALTGCKHHASLSGFGSPSPSASVIGDADVVSAGVEQGPLERLGDFFFGRGESAGETVSGEDIVEDEGEDPIQYVEPVANYKATVHQASVEEDTGALLGPYTLDTGDRVRMFVYGQPNLSRVYSVSDQGLISVPLIGSVLARGRTTRALEGVIKGGLEWKYVKDAQVSIEVAVYRPFFILGEVRAPGQFPYVYGMTVEMAVAVAGGYSPRADKRDIQVTRMIDGERQAISVAPTDYIYPGDSIAVDERFF